MNKNDVVKLLQQSSLMDGLDAKLVGEIAEVGRHTVLKGRHGRIDPTDLSRRLYFVAEGEMRMLRMSPDGQEHLLQRLKKGEYFCLTSIASGRSCNSFMVSAGRVELIYWGHETFRSFLYQNSLFHQNVLSQMACQIEEERDMRALSRCCKADVRVAAYLSHKARQGCCQHRCLRTVDVRPLSLTAQELGIARETLSRSLKRLVESRAINYERGQIRVIDMGALETVLEESECSCQGAAS